MKRTEKSAEQLRKQEQEQKLEEAGKALKDLSALAVQRAKKRTDKILDLGRKG